MSHMIDQTTGSAAIALNAKGGWHGLGQIKPAGEQWSLDQWLEAARLNWQVERVQAGYFSDQTDTGIPVPGAYFNRRSDTKAILGTQTHTERRVDMQPREIAGFIHDYVAVDDRFEMEVMGAIRGGAQIWATAKFNGDTTIGGDRHQSYLLARTSYDGSTGHVFQMTTVRVVCNNTLSAAYADSRAMVTVRHTTKLDKQLVARQLAEMAQGVSTYKAIGDALVQNAMAQDEIVAFFKSMLDIPADAKFEDIGTRKQNQFNSLRQAYGQTIAEGAPAGSAWSALQAVTRYVDHDRTVRGADDVSEAEKRFTSTQFGSGNALKGQAIAFLMPRVRDKVLIAA